MFNFFMHDFLDCYKCTYSPVVNGNKKQCLASQFSFHVVNRFPLFFQEIEKVRAELEKAHKESCDHQRNQAVELALSHAQADWLRNDEEMRQREIDQAVEVATTNAVAEAKEEWEKEIKSQVSIVR